MHCRLAWEVGTLWQKPVSGCTAAAAAPVLEATSLAAMAANLTVRSSSKAATMPPAPPSKQRACMASTFECPADPIRPSLLESLAAVWFSAATRLNQVWWQLVQRCKHLCFHNHLTSPFVLRLFSFSARCLFIFCTDLWPWVCVCLTCPLTAICCSHCLPGLLAVWLTAPPIRCCSKHTSCSNAAHGLIQTLWLHALHTDSCSWCRLYGALAYSNAGGN